MAAVRKKEAEKAAAARAAALQRKQRALKKLGLVAPRNSPFKEEPCLDAARTWFAQVAPCSQRGSCRSTQACEETHAGVADADSCVAFHILFGLLIKRGRVMPALYCRLLSACRCLQTGAMITWGTILDAQHRGVCWLSTGALGDMVGTWPLLVLSSAPALRECT